MQKKEFSIPLRVYIEDTDAGGLVYYVNYLKYMERARTEFLRSLGFPKPAILNEMLAIVVASATIDYKRSATLDDMLSITATVEAFTRSSLIFEQRVLRQTAFGNDELAVATIKLACIHMQRKKPTRFPEPLCVAVHDYLGETNS